MFFSLGNIKQEEEGVSPPPTSHTHTYARSLKGIHKKLLISKFPDLTLYYNRHLSREGETKYKRK